MSWMKNKIGSVGSHDFENAMLAHAKVYCLADYMMLPKVQALAYKGLEAICRVLTKFEPSSPAIGNLNVLIIYVYSHTASPTQGAEREDIVPTEEPLRKFISSFIASRFSTFDLGSDASLRHLLDEGGDFAIDIFNKVRKRMLDAEHQQGSLKEFLRDRNCK